VSSSALSPASREIILNYSTPLANCNGSDLRPTTVSDALQEILRRVEHLYALAGLEIPARKIWGVGILAQDCPEIIVSLLSMRQDEYERNCTAPIRATIQVIVARCSPVSATRYGNSPPHPEQIAAAALDPSADAWVLMRGSCMLDLYGMGLQDVSVEVSGPQGGLQAVTLTFQLVI
jgi:hypothetical protein